MKWIKHILKKIIHTPIIKEESGFTLVEAVASVAILGMVVTPIALIFQGALMTSVDTRVKFQSNQLAQQYVETVKGMTYESIQDLDRALDLSGGLLTEEMMDTFYLDKPVSGQEVHMDLSVKDTEVKEAFGTDADRNPDYMNPELASVEGYEATATIAHSYDILLYLDSRMTTSTYVFDQAHPFGVTELEDVDRIGNTATNRDIHIEYNEGSGASVRDYKVEVDTIKTYSMTDPLAVESSIVIVCDDPSPGDIGNHTELTVTNNTDDILQVFIYESTGNTIDVDFPTDNMSGTVIVKDGLKMVSIPAYRLYEFHVDIVADGETISNLTTTFLSE